MASQVTLSYQVEPAGASSASIVSLMGAAAVPVPPDILQAAGLRVISDLTPVATPVVRTINIGFNPTIAAAAVATLDNEDRLSSITTTVPGIDYILPPRVDIIGGNPERPALAQAFLNLQGTTIAEPGAGYSPATFGVVLGGMAPPTYTPLPAPGADRNALLSMVRTTRPRIPSSCVQAVRIAVNGKGYTTKAQVQFVGGLDPTNPAARPAQAKVTLGPRGRIISVQVTDPGEGYIEVPKIIVVDPGQVNGGLMIVQPNPITGPDINPTTTSSGFVVANLTPIMGQGVAATVAVTVVAGNVTAVAVVTNGARYTQLPQILIIDPAGTGSGAIIVPRMGVDGIELSTGGRGFKAVPTITLTSFFKTLFPDTSDQSAPFGQLMQTAIAVNVISPVSSGLPVLT